MRRRRRDDMTFRELDRRVGRGLAIAWTLIAIAFLIVYGAAVWAMLR
jgi:hypothetical protein